LALHERVLGAEHPLTAQSLNNLAELYRAQGAFERALPLYERALAIRERVLGAEHPDTATSLNNLAAVHYAQGGATRSRVSICCGGFKTAHNPVFYHW
jgi:tetratricopeptide (TPR) repeat protein